MASRTAECLNRACACDQQGGIARHLEYGDFDHVALPVLVRSPVSPVQDRTAVKARMSAFAIGAVARRGQPTHIKLTDPGP